VCVFVCFNESTGSESVNLIWQKKSSKEELNFSDGIEFDRLYENFAR
jgi:hypothetical protein